MQLEIGQTRVKIEPRDTVRETTRKNIRKGRVSIFVHLSRVGNFKLVDQLPVLEINARKKLTDGPNPLYTRCKKKGDELSKMRPCRFIVSTCNRRINLTLLVATKVTTNTDTLTRDICLIGYL